MKKSRRAFFRYHGGKFAIAPWIIDHFPPHLVYVEPYGGSGSVLLQKPKSKTEIYNDLDEDVYNVFKVLRDHGEKLRRVLELTPVSRQEFESAINKTKDPVERARRFLMRSVMAFGTYGHTNQGCGFKPIRSESGRDDAGEIWRGLPNDLQRIIERFLDVRIENRDALELIPLLDRENALFYIDPPYVHSTRALSSGDVCEYGFEMSDKDHEKLAEVLHAVKGMVVLSGYDCEVYQKLYGDWERDEMVVNTAMNKPRTEVLWMRNCEGKRREMPLFGMKEYA